MKQIRFKDVKAVAQGRWGSILSSLVGPMMEDAIERGSRRHSPCPIHGGTRPFRIFKDFEDTGGCICSQCGAFSDGFALLNEAHGWDSSVALKEVATYLGLTDSKTHTKAPLPPRILIKKTETTDEEIQQRTKRTQELWKQGLSINESGAEPMARYMYNRGLDMARTPPALKMILSHSYYDEDKFIANYSAMLAPVLNPQGHCIALHRTYLTFQGLKAPVESPKKLYTQGKSLRGAAIRLFPATNILGVCEGIETALAVNQMTGMPVWACISANLLRQVDIPEDVETVVIWADKDRSRAGQKAATQLAEKLYEEGFEVVIKLPEIDIPKHKKSVDWLDISNAQQTH